MRKLITVAVAATATLALATGAIAQQDDSEATLTVTASPTKSGTAKKPRNVKLGFKTLVDKPGTTVGTIDVLLPRGVKFSGKGLKKCNAEDLASLGITACPSGSKVGPKGTANAALEAPNAPPAPLNFDVYPFVQNSRTFMFYLSLQDGDLQSIVFGKISNRGRKLSIEIPLELRQPVAGVDATLTGLDQVFSGRVGKSYVVSSTKCPRGGWKFGSKLTFSARADGTPAPAPLSRTHKVKCRKP